MSARPGLLAIALWGCTQSAAPGGGGPDAWVDPKLGTDDLQHGGAPGAAAFRTITYALRHATTIHLASGTYDGASGETFPLVLTGEQALLGQPDLSAHIAGNGVLDPTGSAYAAIALAGDANVVSSCDVTTTSANRDAYPACVHLATSGPHVVETSALHDCRVVVEFTGQSGATLRDTTSDSPLERVENCLNGVGDNVHVANFSCTAANDWVFGCGANFTGCGTVARGRDAACSVDLTAFAAACP